MSPEKAAGGFTKRDGSLAFYLRIDSLIRPDMVVLDLGAGRGGQFEEDNFVARFKSLKGKVAKLVGADVDPIVMTNPGLDEAHVFDPTKPLPFADGTFDLIYSDWVLEHIEDPQAFASEIYRILKPGGWFCARTPSRWGYVAVMARLTPEAMQSRFLGIAQPDRKERDVFPKFYRLNTLSTVKKYFAENRFVHACYTQSPDPAYHGRRAPLYRLVDMYQSLPFDSLKTVLLIFLQKKGDAPG